MEHSVSGAGNRFARVIPVNEDPAITRARLLAQLRAAVGLLETVDMASVDQLEAISTQLSGVQRHLFVIRTQNHWDSRRVAIFQRSREVRA